MPYISKVIVTDGTEYDVKDTNLTTRVGVVETDVDTLDNSVSTMQQTIGTTPLDTEATTVTGAINEINNKTKSMMIWSEYV